MIVTINQHISPAGEDCSPVPLPLNHGFSEKNQYYVHGWINEAGELKAILVNDENEIWAISNRHLRYSKPKLAVVSWESPTAKTKEFLQSSAELTELRQSFDDLRKCFEDLYKRTLGTGEWEGQEESLASAIIKLERKQ